MTTPPEIIEAHRAAGLAALSDGHPAWCAIAGILAEAALQATTHATQPDLAAEPRAWQCGYLAAVTDLGEELRRLRAMGQQADA
jgi:hypothetical protein